MDLGEKVDCAKKNDIFFQRFQAGFSTQNLDDIVCTSGGVVFPAQPRLRPNEVQVGLGGGSPLGFNAGAVGAGCAGGSGADVGVCRAGCERGS